MRKRRYQPVVKLVLKELEHGPCTAYDLAEVVGIHIRNMRPYMKLLLEDGLIRKAGVEKRPGTPGPNPPIYRLRRSE